MEWNWQQKKWPEFTYDSGALQDYERDFLHKAGVVQGSFLHINQEDKDSLLVALMSEEALKTSKIEGENLDRTSMQSSLRRQFGLAAEHRKVPPAEQGIAEMLVDLYRTSDQPLTHEKLFSWHRMLTNGRRDLRVMGGYRSHADPMQIVSGSASEPKVHFEAPPSAQVPEEMDAFLTWFNDAAPGGGASQLPLARAGIAHIHFESIHPFEDGNGRIGRAISEKALSQSLGRPTLLALASTIEQGRKDYYLALQKASRTLDLTDWLVYFSQTTLAAQDYTLRLIAFLIEKGKFFDRFGSELNERQAKVLRRMFDAGPEGFEGGLSAENYLSLTRTSRATATRDLQQLVETGALKRAGRAALHALLPEPPTRIVDLKPCQNYLLGNHSLSNTFRK